MISNHSLFLLGSGSSDPLFLYFHFFNPHPLYNFVIMEGKSFNNINILQLANIVFFHEERAEPILEQLLQVEGILDIVSEEIQKQSLDLLCDRNSTNLNRYVEENLAYLSNLSMLLKKKGATSGKFK